MKSTLLCFTLFGALVADVAAQQDPADGDEVPFSRWLDFYAAEAAEYELFVDGAPERKLKLETSPILQYTNPVRDGAQHGAVFVWMLDGRPEAIGSIWSTVDATVPALRDITHEFQSLSLAPLASRHAPRVGRMGPVPDWKSGEAGVELHPLDKAPVAAESPSARLAQMRRLAREFSAKITASDKETSSDLRLLPQPLLRYSSEAAVVIDGALFAFVQATDPELVLMIELRKAANGPQWHYSAARFTNRPLQLFRGDREVWSCDAAADYVGSQPYFIYLSVSKRDRRRVEGKDAKAAN